MPVDRIKELIQEGLRRKLSGDLAGAAEAWTEARRLDPGNVRAREGLEELKVLGVVAPGTVTPVLDLAVNPALQGSSGQMASRKNPFSRPHEPAPFNATPSPFTALPTNATPLSLVAPDPTMASSAPGPSPTQTMVFGAGAALPPPMVAEPTRFDPFKDLALGPSAPPAFPRSPGELGKGGKKFDPFEDLPFGPEHSAPVTPVPAASPFLSGASGTMVFGRPSPASELVASPSPSGTMVFGGVQPSSLAAPAAPSTTMVFGAPPHPLAPMGEALSSSEEANLQRMAFGGPGSVPGPCPEPSQTLVFGLTAPAAPAPLVPAASNELSRTMVFGATPGGSGGNSGSIHPQPRPGMFPEATFGSDGPKTDPFGQPELLQGAPAVGLLPTPSAAQASPDPAGQESDEIIEVLLDDSAEDQPAEEEELDFSFDVSAVPTPASQAVSVAERVAAPENAAANAPVEDSFELAFEEPANTTPTSDPSDGFDLAFEEPAVPELATHSPPPPAPPPVQAVVGLAPAVDELDVGSLLLKATDLLDLDDHSGAMAAVDKILAIDPTNATAQELKARCEGTLLAMCESKLGDLTRRPAVKLKPDEVVWLNLDHRAGFLLSMIDGQVSFEDLFTLSSMSRLETARILSQLVQDKVIG
ncbi:MAG: hypothetical protein HY901_27485 [Deltaproteobacteria bacterium]|nr:hypothetical protein [Deltaproteobacteria bacterium]